MTKRARISSTAQETDDETCVCCTMAIDARAVATKALIQLKKMTELRDEAWVRWDEESERRAEACADAIKARVEAKKAIEERNEAIRQRNVAIKQRNEALKQCDEEKDDQIKRLLAHYDAMKQRDGVGKKTKK